MLRWGMKRDEESSYAGTRVRIGRLAFDETGPRFPVRFQETFLLSSLDSMPNDSIVG